MLIYMSYKLLLPELLRRCRLHLIILVNLKDSVKKDLVISGAGLVTMLGSKEGNVDMIFLENR